MCIVLHSTRTGVFSARTFCPERDKQNLGFADLKCIEGHVRAMSNHQGVFYTDIQSHRLAWILRLLVCDQVRSWWELPILTPRLGLNKQGDRRNTCWSHHCRNQTAMHQTTEKFTPDGFDIWCFWLRWHRPSWGDDRISKRFRWSETRATSANVEAFWCPAKSHLGQSKRIFLSDLLLGLV